MFFFCNTHHVVAAAHFLWRGWICICCSVVPSIRLAVLLNGLNLSTPTPPPWPGWMNDDVALWWPGAGWCVIGVMADCGGSGAEEEPSPQEKIQECWGWWRGSPHLSQWRHAKSEMYRIYTFFFLLLTFCLTLSSRLDIFNHYLRDWYIWACTHKW